MSNAQDNKSPQLQKTEPQKSTPQTGELDAEKLDEVAGGNTASASPHIPAPPAPTP